MPSSTAKPRAAIHTGHVIKSAVYATWGPPAGGDAIVMSSIKFKSKVLPRPVNIALY